MQHSEIGFVIDVLGRLGPPILAASLVGCLLAGDFRPMHGVLMGVGAGLILVHHWATEHRPGRGGHRHG